MQWISFECLKTKFTVAKGFRAAGIYGGLRAKGEKPDLALVTWAFTTNVVAAAPVLYGKDVLNISEMVHAVLINAGQANAVMGNAGYQDVMECANALAKLLNMSSGGVLIESTGVIGQRIIKSTTDLVSKSVAIESQVGGKTIRIGGMAKGSGMIHPNMATMLSVLTTDATVSSDVWRKMVQIAVNRSFNQIAGMVVEDTSTNDTVIALASGLSGLTSISSLQTKTTRFSSVFNLCIISFTIRKAGAREVDCSRPLTLWVYSLYFWLRDHPCSPSLCEYVRKQIIFGGCDMISTYM
ncbi:hypothetical protein UlMin_005313 [Ulmus minor]